MILILIYTSLHNVHMCTRHYSVPQIPRLINASKHSANAPCNWCLSAELASNIYVHFLPSLSNIYVHFWPSFNSKIFIHEHHMHRKFSILCYIFPINLPSEYNITKGNQLAIFMFIFYTLLSLMGQNRKCTAEPWRDVKSVRDVKFTNIFLNM